MCESGDWLQAVVFQVGPPCSPADPTLYLLTTLSLSPPTIFSWFLWPVASVASPSNKRVACSALSNRTHSCHCRSLFPPLFYRLLLPPTYRYLCSAFLTLPTFNNTQPISNYISKAISTLTKINLTTRTNVSRRPVVVVVVVDTTWIPINNANLAAQK